MLYEGPLFGPTDCELGSRGQRPNLSIAKFKKLQAEKLSNWVNTTRAQKAGGRRAKTLDQVTGGGEAGRYLLA